MSEKTKKKPIKKKVSTRKKKAVTKKRTVKKVEEKAVKIQPKKIIIETPNGIRQIITTGGRILMNPPDRDV